jgi:hypothetical protein
MTEAEWLSCNDVQRLDRVVFVPEYRVPGMQLPEGLAFRRKSRLFCCACCRRIAHLLQHPEDHAGLALAEEFAERPGRYRRAKVPRRMPSAAVHSAIHGHAVTVAHNARSAIYWQAQVQSQSFESPTEAKAAQAHLLRDIFGNPFRPVAVNPAWQSSTVVSLAQSIYDDRAFDRMPILADALEDAGCTSADVLDHCRGAGPHVRGCWVVDLLLGKE